MIYHRWFRSLALLCLIFAGAAQAAGPEDISYLTEEYPPANYVEDGKLKGFAVDVLRAVWRKMGVADQPIEVTNWARAYHRVETTPNTMVFTMTRTPEREQRFQWVGPIHKDRYVLVGRSGRGIRVTNPADIARYRVGVIRADIGHKLLLEGGVPDAKLEKLANFRQLVKMLEADRVDLLCIGSSMIATFPRWGGFKPGDLSEVMTISDVAVYYAMSKGTDPALVKRFQSALEAIEPETRRIMKTYQDIGLE